MTDHIIMNLHDSIAEIIINRPEKMNAITPEMSEDLARICADIDKDDGVRVVLLRGAGERAFCAGSDLKSLESYDSAWAFRNRVEYGATLRSLRKPVVAALQGWVLGGGLEIMLGADLRVAGTGARFGAPEVIRGWVGGGGASQFLPRLVGYGQAMRLLLTGDHIDAKEAFSLGLVEYLVEDDAVYETARALCRKLAGYSPLAVQSVKAAVRAALSMPLEAGMKYENELTSLCFAAGNYQEGSSAFGEKRPTKYAED
ncbi:enoyl-CoA hydratase/isomerase family protein [Sodalis sp. dw_96]|uniref:enoyl-CoA hydratase/isomerase family protein n=1 Tax=Sodalis sp. dw_96 TaxID=2719794 RepID=UPI001BD2DD9C|nr:enoyl-CoA hydratase/isomerase family protein [Sodalis sp. dw_96]